MNTRLRITFQLLISACWVLVLAGGLWTLEAYKARAGGAGLTPQRFAEINDSLPSQVPQLRMFIHPHCPCTRASLAELARILPRAQPSVLAEIMIVRPTGVDAGWEESEITRAASRIPGVRLIDDAEGRQANLYGAQTSGHVVFYDNAGNLLYSGGITRARGHAGDNPGSDQLLSLLKGATSQSSGAPTFGCSLLTPQRPCPASGSTCPCSKDIP